MEKGARRRTYKAQMGGTENVPSLFAPFSEWKLGNDLGEINQGFLQSFLFIIMIRRIKATDPITIISEVIILLFSILGWPKAVRIIKAIRNNPAEITFTAIPFISTLLFVKVLIFHTTL